jgi:succinate-acetate transporter protein
MEFAKPSLLALLRFAFPTILLSICNASIFKMNAALLSLAIAHGGLSQLIVGILLLFKAATFRYVLFLSYGAFWCSVVIILVTQGTELETEDCAAPPIHPFMRAYLPLFGIFSFFCGLCAISQNRQLFWTLLALWPSFVLQSVSYWNGDTVTLRADGLLGLICGCLVLYLGIAELETMDHLGSRLLPIQDPIVQSTGSSVPPKPDEPATAVPYGEKIGRIKQDIEQDAMVVIAQEGHWQDTTVIYARVNYG